MSIAVGTILYAAGVMTTAADHPEALVRDL